MRRVVQNILSDFLWYRKWAGGTWYLNRWIFDGGSTVFMAWDRFMLAPYGSGGSCTFAQATYGKLHV